MSEAMLNLMAWLAFGGLVCVLGALSALVYTQRVHATTALRLARAGGNGPSRRNMRASAQSGSLAHLRGQVRQMVVRMGERLAVILGGEARDTAADLSSAGYRGRDALLIYAFLKTVLPTAFLITGSAWVFLTVPFGMDMLMPMGIVIAVALTLSKGIDIVVDKQRQARLGRIRSAFPDMLELLVISSEAGLGPQPALQRVSRELASNAPELASELLQMVSEMAMSNDRRAAYSKLGVRVPLPEIGVFTQTLDQSDTYGTPFARAMRSLIVEQRANRLMAIEEKAARLPVIMTLPLIFCIMPAVFVVLVGPAALNIIDNILAGG